MKDQRKTHPTLVSLLIEMHLRLDGMKPFGDDEYRRRFYSSFPRYHYICSVEKDPTKKIPRNNVVHMWWDPQTERVLEVDAHETKRWTGDPVDKIPVTELSIEEITSRDWQLPKEIPREDVYLLSEYNPKDVMLPILGIKVVPESDTTKLRIEDIEEGNVTFYIYRQSSYSNMNNSKEDE